MRTTLILVLVVLGLLTSSIVHAAFPPHFWSHGYGGTTEDQPFAVARDGGGNLYVTGFFSNTIDFGGGSLSIHTSAGGKEIFLLKLNANGGYLWSRSFGDASDDLGTDVAVDGSGNVFFTGWFAGTVNFGGGPLVSAGVQDIFLAKFDTNGNHVWSKRFGGTDGDAGSALAIDGSGAVVLFGDFSSPALSLGGPTLSASGLSDIFLAKFSSSGAYVWSEGLGGNATDEARDMALDSQGDIVITGDFDGVTFLGGIPLPSNGYHDVFLAKFSPGLSHMFSTNFGGTGDDYGFALAIDPSDNIAITGWFQNTANFGGGNLVSAGNDDIFVAEYDPSGAHRWSRGMGNATLDEGWGIATDAAGSVLSTGYFGGSVDFGGGPMVSTGPYDAFVARYDATGAHLDSEHFGGSGSCAGINVATDGQDLVLTGAFSKTCNLGGNDLMSTGTSDVFIARYSGDHSTPVTGTPVPQSLSIASYPNPFNPRTTLSYTVPARGAVNVSIFDARGTRVATLVHDEAREAGAYQVGWNGRSDDGIAVSSGVYFARIQMGIKTDVRKIVLLK